MRRATPVVAGLLAMGEACAPGADQVPADEASAVEQQRKSYSDSGTVNSGWYDTANPTYTYGGTAYAYTSGSGTYGSNAGWYDYDSGGSGTTPGDDDDDVVGDDDDDIPTGDDDDDPTGDDDDDPTGDDDDDPAGDDDDGTGDTGGKDDAACGCQPTSSPLGALPLGLVVGMLARRRR